MWYPGDMTIPQDRRYQKAFMRSRTSLCLHPSCTRDIPVWNRYAHGGRKPSWEEKSFCSIRCAVRYERMKVRVHRAVVARSAAALIRYCHVCDSRIPAERLRRHHNARSCSDPCSVELRVQTKRQASKRHKRRLSRRRARDRAAALSDTAECAACNGPIPAERRVQWPHVRTCSPACTREHQKHLVKLAKRRQRERQKEAA